MATATWQKKNLFYNIFSDGRPTFIVPVESKHNTYIIGLERSMCELQWDGISSDAFNLETINTVEEDYPRNRFNDGKCDPQGRLWAGKSLFVKAKI